MKASECKLGAVYKGEHVSAIHSLNGNPVLAYTKSFSIIFSSRLEEYLDAAKQALATWQDRKVNGNKDEKCSAPSNIEYFVKEIKRREELLD